MVFIFIACTTMERHKEDTGDYSRSTQDYTYFPVLLPEDSPPLSREECDSIVGNTLLKLEDSLAEV